MAKSYYEIGNNNSVTQNLLMQVLKHINEAITLNFFSWELREIRRVLCRHIIQVDWVFDPVFYIYLKDYISLVVIALPIFFCAAISLLGNIV